MTKMAVWKNGLESKGLKVNMGKTKFMISGRDLHTLQTSGKYLCAACKKGFRKYSILCSGCSFWVHKKFFNIPGRVVKDPEFRFRRCLGNGRAIDGRPCVEVQLPQGKIDVVDNFVYFGILVTVFEVVSLPLLRDATQHGENLENSYPCLLVKQFL